MNSNNPDAEVVDKVEPNSDLEQYLDKFIEGADKYDAINGGKVHASLLAGAEWSRERHGPIEGINDIDATS